MVAVAIVPGQFMQLQQVLRRAPPRPNKEDERLEQADSDVNSSVDGTHDRRAAQWILDRGGKAVVKVNGQSFPLEPGSPLPKLPFKLTSIDFIGVRMPPS